VLDDDLRGRARRLLSGNRRVDDLDRLFLGLRDRDRGRASFREVGDFVAHRGERQKGVVTQICQDVFTSFDVWSMKFRGKDASLGDIVRAAQANFRLASDFQLRRGCGMPRAKVKRHLVSSCAKIETGTPISDQECRVLLYLGNRFIWKPAFTDERLFNDFRDVLLLNAILSKSEAAAFESVKEFLTLYAISVMHGCTIVYEGGDRRLLLAGFANRERHLEVKIQINFEIEKKPVMAPICMFLTSLSPGDHCEPSLLELGSDYLADAWREPIEVGREGKLSLVR
jgi:hypothetical protein